MKKRNILLGLALAFCFTACYDLDKMPEGVLSTAEPFRSTGEIRNYIDLPNSWVHKAGLQKVQVFFSGENLLTFTKLKGMFDPEAIFSSNSYTSEGGKNYPMNRVLSLGFIVNL